MMKNGFQIIGQNGSHVKMKNSEAGRTVIVPYHSKDLKKEMEQAILKQAGVNIPEASEPDKPRGLFIPDSPFNGFTQYQPGYALVTETVLR